MNEQFLRTELLIGEKNIEKLMLCSVAVFGVGGVGSFAAEALARSGIGTITIFDDDIVSVSNINRQLIATHQTVGMNKVDVMKQRILDINPNASVFSNKCFYTKENANNYDLSQFDYIVDAIDTVSSKLILAERTASLGIPLISCMGTGNKLDPTQLEITDIYKTSVCPLARVMRYELRKRGIKKLKVLYSKEQPLVPASLEDTADTQTHKKRQTPGSMAFVPSAAGLIIAGAVVRDLIGM